MKNVQFCCEFNDFSDCFLTRRDRWTTGWSIDENEEIRVSKSGPHCTAVPRRGPTHSQDRASGVWSTTLSTMRVIS